MDWFLIESEEDHSYSIMHNSFVINAGDVKVSDTVTFFYRNKPFVGIVKMFGERDACNDELEKLGQEAKRTTKDPASEAGSTLLGKRRSNRTTRFGVSEEVVKPNSNPNPKRSKKSPRKKDRENIVKGIKSLSPSTSPTKEALKVRLRQAELKLQMLLDNDGKHSENNDAFNESSKHSESNDQFNDFSKHSENNDPFNDSSKLSENNDVLNDSVKDHGSADLFSGEDDEKKSQMYGNSEGFILLNNNVYCSKRVLKEALTKSTNVCHIARRLLVGVFKPEALEACTLTGQEWRAGPSDRKSADALYQPGVNAIIEYAKTAATKRKWKVPKADTPIKHSMSCRLGEIKRMIKDQGVSALKKKYL